MRLMSCNIRYSAARDGGNAWPLRRQIAADVILSRSPDAICFQEVSREQYLFLRAALPGYDAYAMVDQPTGQSPQNAIFWLRERYALISAGGYWLSETPHVPGSKSWESSNVRLANWVRLAINGSAIEIRVVGTHLDHVSQTARENQARIINEDAAAFPDTYPQALLGDMNAPATNPAIQAFLQAGWHDTFTDVHPEEDPGESFHAFQGASFEAAVGKIDWVLVRGRLRVVGAEIVRDARDGRFPSDHYFVTADVEFPS